MRDGHCCPGPVRPVTGIAITTIMSAIMIMKEIMIMIIGLCFVRTV
jgi:hypothetical protein